MSSVTSTGIHHVIGVNIGPMRKVEQTIWQDIYVYMEGGGEHRITLYHNGTSVGLEPQSVGSKKDE